MNANIEPPQPIPQQYESQPARGAAREPVAAVDGGDQARSIVLQLVVAIGVGAVANYWLMWAWSAFCAGVNAWPVPRYALPHGAMAGAVAWFIYLIAHSRIGIAGALLAGVPALLLPLTNPLAPMLVGISEYVYYPPGTGLLYYMAMFGAATWTLVLLDALLPKWTGLLFAAVVLLGLSVPYSLEMAALTNFRTFDSSFIRDAGLRVINDVAPVWLPFAAMKLIRNAAQPTDAQREPA